MKFVRTCGHEEQVACSEAFRRAKEGAAPCRVPRTAAHPHCEHPCGVPCHLEQQMQAVPRLAPVPVDEVRQGSTPPFPANLPRAGMPACKAPVLVHRECGHSEKVPCGQARGALPPCKELVRVRSPLCGHEVSVPCHVRAAVEAWRPWTPDAEKSLREADRLPPGSVPKPGVSGNAPSNPEVERALKS